jgi:clan AA aspartic protease (TIGR02281 family)
MFKTLTAIALVGAVALAPVPAAARGNGVGLALGIIGGIIAGAAVANANQPPPAYYPPQPAYAPNSAACQSWLAVLNNPRYDAGTRAQAQQIVSSCGLPAASYENLPPAPPYENPAYANPRWEPPAAAPMNGATEVKLDNVMGQHYALTASINGLPARFMLDTGAGTTQITKEMARQLVNQGLLTEADWRGMASMSNADGHASQVGTVRLDRLTVGGRTVSGLTATISSVPLLGQDFLRQLGTYTIDNRRGVLILG